VVGADAGGAARSRPGRRSLLDPTRALTLTSTDLNGIVTTQQYDPLGRLTAVWLHSRATTANANYTYAYQVSNSAVTAVTTNQLDDENQYFSSVALYDGMLRVRQTQTTTPRGGRLVNDTLYDSRGWTRAKYTNWWDPSTNPTVGPVAYATDLGAKVDNEDYYTYDGLGRTVVDQSDDDNKLISATTTVYNGDRTTTIPPTGGITQTTVTDPLGRTVELDQYTAQPTLSLATNSFTGISTVTGGTTAATHYGYDGHGQQATITTSDNATWTTSYDLLGHAASKTDPDAGTSSTLYDSDGNAVQTTDARGKTISYTFDALNRKTGQYDAPLAAQSSSNQLASWIYDNANAVSGVTNPIGQVTTTTAYRGGNAYVTQSRGFNVFGESLGQDITIPTVERSLAGTYTFKHTYTKTTGLLATDVYPAAGGLPSETVQHGYATIMDTPDRLASNLAGYAVTTTFDALSRPASEQIGGTPGTSTLSTSYDPHTGRITEQRVQRPTITPTTLDVEDYTYDLAGNIIRQDSTRLGATSPTETQCYTYDNLDQLTAAWTATDSCAVTPTSTNHSTVGDSLGAASAYWTTWSIDPLGDRTGETQHTTTGGTDATTSYAYNGNNTNQPHTLTATSTTGATTSQNAYTYDAAGNMVTRTTPAQGNQTLTWDDTDELAAVAGATTGTTSFVYDTDSNLLLQKDPDATVLYLPDEQLVLTSAGGASGTRYYTLPGGGTAVRTGSAGTAFTFEITDQHDTPVLYLDNTAQQPTWRQYTPYGADRGASVTSPDNHSFLNKPDDTDVGLTRIGARSYDTDTGRFISVDPLLTQTDPRSLNGYAYADSNPVNGSDATGRMFAGDNGLGYGNITDVDNANGQFAEYQWEQYAEQQDAKGKGSCHSGWQGPDGACHKSGPKVGYLPRPALLCELYRTSPMCDPNVGRSLNSNTATAWDVLQAYLEGTGGTFNFQDGDYFAEKVKEDPYLYVLLKQMGSAISKGQKSDTYYKSYTECFSSSAGYVAV
jgi:RHS repeat-associated protein